MRIIDPHAHMYSRTTEDYEKMSLAGVEAVVEPSFWLGSPRTHVGTFIDYFEHIIGFETQRAKQYGVDHFTCIAMNPREANNKALANEVLPIVEKFCLRETCVAVGEIGFDNQTAEEEFVLRSQLQLAKKYDMPVLVHLPHQHKKVGTERTLQVIKDTGLSSDRILIDHNNEETMPLYAGTKFWRGITVYPITKVSVERAANMVEQYGVERLLINSACDWGPSDPLSVAKVVRELQKRDKSRELIEQLVFHNPAEFFGQSERWTFKK